MSSKTGLFERLEGWRRGEPITADKLTETNDAVNDLAGIIRESRQVGGAATAFTLRQFRIVSLSDTADDAGKVLVAEQYDGFQGGEKTIIAKPTDLQPEDHTRDGITYTYSTASQRTADNGSGAETQVIVPSYVVGDIVIAASGVKGMNLSVDLLGQGQGAQVSWLDINVSGRAWAKAAE